MVLHWLIGQDQSCFGHVATDKAYFLVAAVPGHGHDLGKVMMEVLDLACAGMMVKAAVLDL